MAKRILSKVKKITLNLWTVAEDGSLVAPASEATQLNLDAIVADSTTLAQDDNDVEEIDCETSDSPIIEVVTLGDYTIEMTSADISDDILTQALGYSAIGTLGVAAPSSYEKRYACIELTFDDAKWVLPKVLLTSTIDGSSLKTNVFKGTISGTCYDVTVTAGESSTKTPLFVCSNATSVIGTDYTFAE